MEDTQSQSANELLKRRGFMIVLSSPSGAGKTSLSKALLEHDKHLKISVSLTTRPPRPGEVNGKDYHFVSREEFERLIQEDYFFEYAEVFDNFYGTPKHTVKEYLGQGYDVLFDIDWQGTQQISQRARGALVTIFILPPSINDLEKRLKNREQDSEDVVTSRMSRAVDEISHWPEYEYVILNADFSKSLEQLQAILEAERLKRERQIGLPDFIRKLRQHTL